jgi:hypothetical protein
VAVGQNGKSGVHVPLLVVEANKVDLEHATILRRKMKDQNVQLMDQAVLKVKIAKSRDV